MGRYCILLFLFLVVTNGSNCFVVLGGGGSSRQGRSFLYRLHTKIRKVDNRQNLCMEIDSTSENNNTSNDAASNETASLFNNLGRRERKRAKRAIARQQRINAWLAKYGSSEALQQTFGQYATRQLNPTQTRALYHALLPRSLLALSELDILDPSDLAPLAHQARIAAKEYARSRCSTSSKVLMAINPELRKKYNQPSMTWDDVWYKYESQIMEEERTKASEENRTIDDEELMMQIYMRILEKSCATNEAFDGLFLKEDERKEGEDELTAISTQLESDIQSILLDKKEKSNVIKQRNKIEKNRIKSIKKEEKERIKGMKKIEKLKKKLEKRRRKQHDHEAGD